MWPIFFFALTLLVTWPLARQLGHAVPSDYGDPLYAAWAIAWVTRQLGRVLTGDFQALRHFFDANQLHPEPAALVLSDHFVGQALPLAPIFWVTGNAVTTLGVAYIVALWLSAVSAWLLVRELTGSQLAGAMAGCVFAFNEFFLVFEIAHLQMLSAHWMPLTLYGLRIYFAHGRWQGLAVAALSIVMLNLSAGYYMLMFPPFVVLYVAWELTARRRWFDRRTWRDLAMTGAAAVACTAPFVLPYVQAQQRLGFTRTVSETAAMSAAVDGYLDSTRRLFGAYLCAGLALVAWPILRSRRSAVPLPLVGFAAGGLALAFWLSLGPAPRWGADTYPGLGLYRLFQESIPGMSAVRVSSRFAVLFVLFLAVLAGSGAALLTRLRIVGHVAVVLLAASVLWWSVPRPFPLDRESLPSGVNAPPPYLKPGGEPPAVYRHLASLPSGTIVAELPFTDLGYQTRYLLFSTFHWHPLVNGFTSFFPPGYVERVRWLVNPVRTPDEAWAALRSADTTHVVVHTGAWEAAYAQQLDDWLTRSGATKTGRFDGAVVYQLPPP